MSVETILESGTWNPPSGVTVGTVSVVDGGGGGAAGFSIYMRGGAGGGGRKIVGMGLSAGMVAVIGAGGAAGIYFDGENDGGTGGLTTFAGEGTGETVGAQGGGDDSGADASVQTSQYKGGSGGAAPYNGGSAADPVNGLDGVQDGGDGQPGDGGLAVVGVFATGNPGQSGKIVIEYILPAPAVPTGLLATGAQTGHIPVSWDAVSGASGYRLYSSDDGYVTPIYDGATNAFDHTGLAAGITKTYKVSAYGPDLESAPSGTASATTDNPSSLPVITAVSIPNTTMKIGDVVTATITVTADTDNYTTGSGGLVTSSINGFALGSLAKTNNTTYTATFTIASGGTDRDASASIPLSVTLKNSSGSQGNTFTTAIVHNADQIDANRPTVTSIELEADGKTITCVLSEDNCIPASGTGHFTLGGTTVTVASWTCTSQVFVGAGFVLQFLSVVRIVLNDYIMGSATLTLTYTKSNDATDITDAAGNSMANFADSAVTNNSIYIATHLFNRRWRRAFFRRNRARMG